MQVMPATARIYGVTDLLDPEENIKAGTALLARLQRLYSDVAADRDEMTKITLAAYNAGPGRIADCIRLARAQGVDPSTWSNLCSVIPLMSQEADSLAGQDVLYGPFKGKETMAFVKAVLNQYDIFRGLPPRFRMTVDTLETESGDFPPDEDDTDGRRQPAERQPQPGIRDRSEGGRKEGDTDGAAYWARTVFEGSIREMNRQGIRRMRRITAKAAMSAAITAGTLTCTGTKETK